MRANLEYRDFGSLFAAPLRNGVNRPTAVRGSGVQMVNMGELFAHSRIGAIPMERVHLSEKETTQYLLQRGDLLFARQSLVWNGAGKCSIFLGTTEPTTFEGHIIRVRINPAIASPDFYYYFFISPPGRQAIETIIEQVAAAGIRGSDLVRLAVPYPDILEQRAIARILSALDDKIELNRRMNHALEAMASALFKSWFVDFDPVVAKADGREPYGLNAELAALFPATFQDSELGQIPAAWHVAKLADITTTQYGYTASASKAQIGPRFLRITDMNKAPWIDWKDVPFCAIADDAKLRYALTIGDVLVSRMADPGKAAIVEEDVDAVFASYLVRLRATSIDWAYFLYYFLRSEQYLEYASGAMIGSVQMGMNAKVIVDASAVIPTDTLVMTFANAIAPYRKRIVANLKELRTLTAIRDALLPRLLSGEIHVKTAEREVEQAIAG